MHQVQREATGEKLQGSIRRVSGKLVSPVHLSPAQAISTALQEGEGEREVGEIPGMATRELCDLHVDDSQEAIKGQRDSVQSGGLGLDAARSLSSAGNKNTEQRSESARQFSGGRSDSSKKRIREGQCVRHQPASEHAEEQRDSGRARGGSEIYEEFFPCIVFCLFSLACF